MIEHHLSFLRESLLAHVALVRDLWPRGEWHGRQRRAPPGVDSARGHGSALSPSCLEDGRFHRMEWFISVNR